MEKDNIDKIVQLGHELGTIRKSGGPRPICCCKICGAEFSSRGLMLVSKARPVPARVPRLATLDPPDALAWAWVEPTSCDEEIIRGIIK